MRVAITANQLYDHDGATPAKAPSSFGTGLFGAFTAADAFYAPVATRFVTYGVRLPDVVKGYVDAVLALPAVQEWSAAARVEPEVIAAEEPYAHRYR